MKDNWNLVCCGNNVALVPYSEKFVPNYHKWMTNPEILELTASDSLSLDEEFEMQSTWKNDPTKCTFIVLSIESSGNPFLTDCTNTILDHPTSTAIDEESMMAGDVNLFLHDSDDPGNAEIEIMIAEEKYQRRGYARESLNIMMYYGVKHLNVHRFFAKINENNFASINLFKSLGYIEINYVSAFQEFEYEFRVELGSNIDIINERASHVKQLPYSHS